MAQNIWTDSFLGISACFYHCPSNQSQHALLNLHRICHRHNGEAIANCIDSTLNKQDIPESKVLLIVMDNGSNMIKAVELLKKKEIGTAQKWHSMVLWITWIHLNQTLRINVLLMRIKVRLLLFLLTVINCIAILLHYSCNGQKRAACAKYMCLLNY